MNQYFTEEMFVQVRNKANRQDYLTKLVNQNCIFIYTSPDDNRQAFVLTINDNGFTLIQFNNDGSFGTVCENMTILDDVLTNFEFIVNC